MGSRVRRLYFGLLALGVGINSGAQELDCQDLAGDERTYCFTMVVCQSLDSVDARAQCIAEAARILAKELTTDEVKPTAPSQDSSEAVVTPSIAVEEPPLRVQESSIEQEIVRLETTATASKPEELRIVLTTKNAFARTDPDEFSATIINYRTIDYDSALVLLNNGLVFVVEGSRRSRLRVGDTIIATQSQVTARRHYIFTGGRGGAVSARRVRCEYPLPSQQTRLRCARADRLLEEYRLE